MLNFGQTLALEAYLDKVLNFSTCGYTRSTRSMLGERESGIKYKIRLERLLAQFSIFYGAKVSMDAKL